MKLYGLIFHIGMMCSKKRIICSYGTSFFTEFQRKSRMALRKVLKKTPDIGKSIFSFNYQFTPAYIAWYRASGELKLTHEEAIGLLWMMNEQIMRAIPRILRPAIKTRYLNGFRRQAPLHQSRSEQGAVHPYDYKIAFRDIEKNTFEIDITQCGMIRLCRDFDALALFPAVCRMDYLFAHYLGHGFERTTTLGDGDRCCNCRYILDGSCEWAPEKGFGERR